MIGIVDERAHDGRIEIDRQTLFHSRTLERNSVVGIERRLSRHRAEALPQCSGTGGVIVRLIIGESELGAGLRLLGRDRFVVRQRRLTPDAAIVGILEERAGDRPSRILD